MFEAVSYDLGRAAATSSRARIPERERAACGAVKVAGERDYEQRRGDHGKRGLNTAPIAGRPLVFRKRTHPSGARCPKAGKTHRNACEQQGPQGAGYEGARRDVRSPSRRSGKAITRCIG